MIKPSWTRHALGFFCEVKNVDKHQKSNRKDDRWLCAGPSEVLRVMHMKFPAIMSVSGVVSSEGHVIPPHVFRRYLKINEVLEALIKHRIDIICNGRPYVFCQVPAPSQKSLDTFTIMQHSRCDLQTRHIWILWTSAVRKRPNRHPYNTIASQESVIVQVVSEMNKDHIVSVC